MAEGVSDSDSWIHIEGMNQWHIKWALHAITTSNVGMAT
jgi:hypothetical protein